MRSHLTATFGIVPLGGCRKGILRWIWCPILGTVFYLLCATESAIAQGATVDKTFAERLEASRRINPMSNTHQFTAWDGKMFNSSQFNHGKASKNPEFQTGTSKLVKDAQTKTFEGTSRFKGSKDFKVGEANTKTRNVLSTDLNPDALKTSPTSQIETKSSRENAQSLSTGEYKTSEARVRGASQARFDDEKAQRSTLDARKFKDVPSGPMSIGEVRELLNKTQ